jgi:hypothetical protein
LTRTGSQLRRQVIDDRSSGRIGVGVGKRALSILQNHPEGKTFLLI